MRDDHDGPRPDDDDEPGSTRRDAPRVERDDEGGPLESPPEGASCVAHPERTAVLVCPRCRRNVCMGCWHHAIRRCHACLRRDPTDAAPPLPWEDDDAPLVSRWLGTLASALTPGATAPAFLEGTTARAWTFWLSSFVPLALVAWVVPLTHTVLFGPAFRIARLGTPSPDDAAVALDVARAVGLGALIGLAELVAIALPYRSLASAFADRGNPHAPTRVLLYRSFLIPLSTVLRAIVAWGLPAGVAPGALELLQFLSVVPLVLLFVSLQTGARMGSGVGPLAALPTALVPFVLMMLVQAFLLTGLASWFPSPAAPPAPALAPAAPP